MSRECVWFREFTVKPYFFLFQFIAITWIKEFVQLSGASMLPYMSNIFTAVLPCLAYDSDSRRSILVFLYTYTLANERTNREYANGVVVVIFKSRHHVAVCTFSKSLVNPVRFTR